METAAVMTDKSALISDVKERLQDIYLAISWRELKRDYSLKPTGLNKSPRPYRSETICITPNDDFCLIRQD